MTMSMVAATGNLPRFERLYGNAPAATGGVPSPDRPTRRDDDDQRAARGNDDGPGRRNPLVRALMQALQGLMPASAANTSPGGAAAGAAASATPVSTATTTIDAADAADAASSTSTPPAAAADTGTLKDAAVAFAHELFGALRGLGGDERDGHRHAHHHHGHHHGHGRGRDYGDLAQGLRQLAQSIDTAAALPAAPAPTALPSAQPVSTAPATPAPEVAPPVDEAPLATTPAEAAPIAGTTPVTLPGGTNIEINIQIKIQLPGSPAGAAPATPAPAEESPLLAAFKRLMDKLAPGNGTGDGAAPAATDGSSPAEKLKAFLNGIADALSGSPDAGATTRPAVGSLLSVAA